MRLYGWYRINSWTPSLYIAESMAHFFIAIATDFRVYRIAQCDFPIIRSFWSVLLLSFVYRLYVAFGSRTLSPIEDIVRLNCPRLSVFPHKPSIYPSSYFPHLHTDRKGMLKWISPYIYAFICWLVTKRIYMFVYIRWTLYSPPTPTATTQTVIIIDLTNTWDLRTSL